MKMLRWDIPESKTRSFKSRPWLEKSVCRVVKLPKGVWDVGNDLWGLWDQTRLAGVRTMDTTYLHIGMILSTLGLSPHGFALGLYPKGLIPMEIFVHPYIPMILPISSQCGTLVVYPTILPSNKGPPSLPSNRSFIRPLSTNQDSSFSTSPCWGQNTSMKHPESTTWLESFCSF
jgi:hypothetical protein